MITLKDFAPYVHITQNLKSEQIEPYIVGAKEIDLLDVIGKDNYDTFFALYNQNFEIIAINPVGNSTEITIADTSGLPFEGYLFLKGEPFNQRVSYQVVTPTGLLCKIDITAFLPLLTGQRFVTWFADKALWEIMHKYIVLATWLRYAQVGKIQSTNAGLVQKNTDFSEFVSDTQMSLYVSQYRRDLAFYRNKLIEYYKQNCSNSKKRNFLVVR